MTKLVVVIVTVFALLAVTGLSNQIYADEIYGCYKKKHGQLRIVGDHSECKKSEVPIILSGGGVTPPPTPWVCPDDDVANGIYRICNYFPFDPNNQWKYTTGDRFISDNTHTCTSGYSGILYGTNTYEYSPYMQNGEDGLLFAGCEYEEGSGFKDFGIHIVFMPPQMQVGETVSTYIPPNLVGSYSVTFDTTFIGLELITVPAGTFDTLKIEIMIQHGDDSCSYKTTVWLAKGIGPIKIHRTEPNPPDCLGCIFVCDPNNDVNKLNTPAELMSIIIKGITY